MLGKARALTYAGRHEDALATIDALLALGRWLVGDARYWRALNEAQLERNEEAWADVELAAKLLVNAEVPKLAGLIAYRRNSSTCRARSSRNRASATRRTAKPATISASCSAEQGVWTRTADVLVETDRCLQDAERKSPRRRSPRSRRRPIRPNAGSGRSRDASSRSRTAAGMMATSWFNIAVAYYNLSRKDEARQFAEKVVADEQFGERARELLTRLR